MREVVYEPGCRAALVKLSPWERVRVESALETVARSSGLGKDAGRDVRYTRIRLDHHLVTARYTVSERQIRVFSVELLYVSPN